MNIDINRASPAGTATCPARGLPPPKSNYELPQAWADWINEIGEWDWFGHFTFKGNAHPEQANKVFHKWKNEINREVFGRSYYKYPDKGVIFARASELQQRGVVHYHAVLGRIASSVDRYAYKARWEELGGMCLIYPYIKNYGAEFYMAKNAYAWKHGEIDVGGPVNQSSIVLRSRT